MGGIGCTATKSFEDDNGHGTFVAGFIGAKDNGFGRVGVAPAARLWAVKVLDKGGKGNDSQIIRGVDWVTSTRSDGDPSNDIAVANMSLTGPDADDGNCGLTKKSALHLAICNSVGVGVTYVVAAGNDAVDFQTVGPANYNEVLAVTAMADSDGLPGAVGGPRLLRVRSGRRLRLVQQLRNIGRGPSPHHRRARRLYRFYLPRRSICNCKWDE